ncbi:hypothetical protein CC80DRAFT_499873 [Byssothecium circinans]|uniref:Uncharacterized protein n=1 Tax=Byssothecium circinans TaxID=147558 RepID=A0A6A5UCS3_9PLEO|nr:hypothetical protein CC80DRAFT_499873 [Byssothecium circinans]
MSKRQAATAESSHGAKKSNPESQDTTFAKWVTPMNEDNFQTMLRDASQSQREITAAECRALVLTLKTFKPPGREWPYTDGAPYPYNSVPVTKFGTWGCLNHQCRIGPITREAYNYAHHMGFEFNEKAPQDKAMYKTWKENLREEHKELASGYEFQFDNKEQVGWFANLLTDFTCQNETIVNAKGVLLGAGKCGWTRAPYSTYPNEAVSEAPGGLDSAPPSSRELADYFTQSSMSDFAEHFGRNTWPCLRCSFAVEDLENNHPDVQELRAYVFHRDSRYMRCKLWMQGQLGMFHNKQRVYWVNANSMGSTCTNRRYGRGPKSRDEICGGVRGQFFNFERVEEQLSFDLAKHASLPDRT